MADASPPAPPVPSGDPAVLLFDGTCRLCLGAVRFIRARDIHRRFRFLPLQSNEAEELLRAEDMPEPRCDTVILLEAGRLHERSTAMLRALRRLPAPWSLLSAALVVPRPLRDWVYSMIARNRYRWFGRIAADAAALNGRDASPGAEEKAASCGERKGTGALR